MDTLFDSLKLGHLLDGLVCVYGVFKRSINRKNKIQQNCIITLKNTLTDIYQLLPAHLQQDYKKKRLGKKELDLLLLEKELQAKLKHLVKQGITESCEVYKSIFKENGYDYTIQNVALLCGKHRYWARYFFRELGKDSYQLFLIMMISPDKVRSIFYLQDSSFVIGRNTGLNVVIAPDPLISMPHCRLTQTKGQLIIEDLQSKNGTYVQGKMIKNKSILLSGDQVRIGNTYLLFEIIERQTIADTFETKILSYVDDNEEDHECYSFWKWCFYALLTVFIIIIILLIF